MAFRPLLLTVIFLPAFALLLAFGIHTTHDYHVFRQQQFNLCAVEGSLPCRWSPAAGFGYGEPMFNYYGQFPYLIGYTFSVLGFSLIDSVKALFILSLVGSGFTMYILARELWGPRQAMVSAIAYVYAPYRAVDVWVRGALPEAVSFIYFPVILLLLYRYIRSRRPLLLPALTLTLTLLIITHNLSAFMFAPFALVWTGFWLFRTKSVSAIPGLIAAGLFALVLSAFYLLPVVFESQLITINLTTQNYYQYVNHYVSLSQLFLSRFWGYGGSTWGPNDTLSFAVGHLHWLAGILAAVWALVRLLRRSATDQAWLTLLCLACAAVALFLTHGKSDPIWHALPGLAYVQFPWRFLGVAVFFLALAVGSLPARFLPLLAVGFVLVSAGFFRPDIWQPISDGQLFSGALGDKQLASTVQDYWPTSAKSLPTSPAPAQPWLELGEGTASFTRRGAHQLSVLADITSSSANLIIPQTYFPSWVATVDGQPFPISGFTPDLHLMTLHLPAGVHHIDFTFTDTPVRRLANWLSVIGLFGLGLWTYRLKTHAH